MALVLRDRFLRPRVLFPKCARGRVDDVTRFDSSFQKTEQNTQTAKRKKEGDCFFTPVRGSGGAAEACGGGRAPAHNARHNDEMTRRRTALDSSVVGLNPPATLKIEGYRGP
ncbi:unnamed protein product [Ixodes pacificus]